MFGHMSSIHVQPIARPRVSFIQGLTSVSVNWGAWAGSGMAAGAGLARMERLGFGAIPPAAGAAALGAVLRSLHSGDGAAAQLTGSVFLWDRYLSTSTK